MPTAKKDNSHKKPQLKNTKSNKGQSRVSAPEPPPPKSREEPEKIQEEVCKPLAAACIVSSLSAHRWRSVMWETRPCDNIGPSLLPYNGNKPPLLFYGWPFNDDHMIAYAKYPRLSFPVPKHDREISGFGEVFNFGDICEEHYGNKTIITYLRNISCMLTLRDLWKATGVRLEIGRPVSLKWSSILILWTNYNVDEQYAILDSLNKYEVVKILDEAMNLNEDCEKTTLRWWWSMDGNGNDLPMFDRLV